MSDALPGLDPGHPHGFRQELRAMLRLLRQPAEVVPDAARVRSRLAGQVARVAIDDVPG